MSAAVKHTPGPWAVYEDDPIVIINSGGSSLGEMSAGDPFIGHDEMKANALLASASPDLVDALQDALEALAMCQPRTDHGARCQSEAMQKARVALAKAKGELS